MMTPQFAVREMVREATIADRAEVLSRLREGGFNSSYYLESLRGFIAANSSGANWQELHQELGELAATRGRVDHSPEETERKDTLEQEEIRNIIAVEWARHDLPVALDWYRNTLAREVGPAKQQSLLQRLLESMPLESRGELADWMVKRQSQDQLDERTIVSYLGNSGYQPWNESIERIVGLPKEEANRLKIVESMHEWRRRALANDNGPSPEEFARIVYAARLSDAQTEHWLKVTPFEMVQ